MSLTVEVNDVTAPHSMPAEQPFWVGSMINVHSEGTLRWLAKQGAQRVCLPPDCH